MAKAPGTSLQTAAPGSGNTENGTGAEQEAATADEQKTGIADNQATAASDTAVAESQADPSDTPAEQPAEAVPVIGQRIVLDDY